MNEEGPTHRLEDLEAALREVFGEPPVGLDALRDIHLIHRSLLQHEERRLTKRLGRKHPRVRGLGARLEHNLSLIKGFEVQVELAAIRVPEVEAKDALIHGRVADEHQRGLTGLTVEVEDERGKTVRFLGKADTDASGYFALRVDPATVARLSKVEGEGGYLTVRTRTGKLVHREPALVKLAEGDRVFVQVGLKREDLRPVQKGKNGVARKEGDKGGGTPASEPWVVRGRVTDETGIGMKGLMVRLFDKDRRYDDKLGATLTDEEGDFTISYRIQDFREGPEPGADLYLSVMDAEGKELYSSEKAVRFDAGREEVFDITIRKEEDADDTNE